MVKKKNVITVGLLFSFLHGYQKEMPPLTVKHEGFVLNFPTGQKKLQTFVTSDYYQECTPTRDVIFQNDLLDLITLDETCRKHLERFKRLNVIIQSVNEYRCPRDQQVTVKIYDNKLTIVIKNMSEDLLLECLPFDFIPKIRSQNPLEKYMSLATQWLTKVGIYIWGKVIAKYRNCTIIINRNIRPEEKHILCSDIIIDLYDLKEADKLHWDSQIQDLFNTKITLSEK